MSTSRPRTGLSKPREIDKELELSVLRRTKRTLSNVCRSFGCRNNS